jgi:putative methionine-R-sulfoxide reductase with GAF domain
MLRDEVRLMHSAACNAFLADLDARLAALDPQLDAARTPADVAWALCEFSATELGLVDVVAYLVGADGLLAQEAGWGPKRAADQLLESKIHLAVGQGIVGACAEQKVPLRVDDTRQDPRYVSDVESNRSELAVPICHAGELFGVLDSEHPEAGFYGESHERALLAIADRGAARLRAMRGDT